MKNQPIYPPINPHFFKPLLPGFTNHIDIPVTFFLKYLEGCNQGNTVELRTDASEIIWKVNMEGRRLSDGWEEFVVAHDLRVGDIVVFKHEGEFVFHVTALGPNCCEVQYKEDSHEEDKTYPSKATRQGECLKANEKYFFGVEATDKEFLGVEEKKYLPFEKPTNEDIRQGKEYVSTEFNTREVNSTKSSPQSQNRFVTLTLTPTSFKTCRLSLPLEFTKGNGIFTAGKITMLDRDGARWSTSLLMDHNKRGTMSLGRGWKGYCEVNEVKMDDSFVLELIWEEDTAPVLKFCSKG